MSVPSKFVLAIDLGAPVRRILHWDELGYRLHVVGCALVDACEAEPGELEQRVRAQLAADADPAVLLLACEPLATLRVADTRDWQSVLHQPLTHCFTAVRGLVPWVAARPQGGHIIALLARTALLPDNGGSAAVFGRALLGLFESLRAELRQTATRVTLCITDENESAEDFQARLQQVLNHRPFYSLPASIDRTSIEEYFGPLVDALARTPLGMPLPAGPQGEVYHLE